MRARHPVVRLLQETANRGEGFDRGAGRLHLRRMRRAVQRNHHRAQTDADAARPFAAVDVKRVRGMCAIVPRRLWSLSLARRCLCKTFCEVVDDGILQTSICGRPGDAAVENS